MNFLSPIRLVLLAVPAALLVAYVVAQRVRRKYAVRFTSVELLVSVAPRRPGWQRHVPTVAMLFALVALVVGFARPTTRVRTPRKAGNVVLVLDTSASMGATDIAPNRLTAAQKAAHDFVDGLPTGLGVGLLSFDGNARVLVPPTTDRAAVGNAIDALELGPGTATGDAIDLSLSTIEAAPKAASGKTAPAVVVLMSDGTPTVGDGDQTPQQTVDAAAAAAKAAGVPVNTIAYGTSGGTVNLRGQDIPVPADPQALAAIAKATGGKTFTAASAGQLKKVYGELTHAVGYDTHRQETTAWFTGAGLILAALAAVGALVWNQRLP